MLRKSWIGVLLLGLLVTGCAAEAPEAVEATQETPPAAVEVAEEASPTQEKSDETDEKEAPEETDLFTAEVEGQTFAMHQEAEPLLRALGEPQSYFEAESCAFKGYDRMYNYGSYEVATYEGEKGEHILSLVIFDDTLPTAKGIYLYDKKEDVVEVYGEPHRQSETFLVYEEEGVALTFLLDEKGHVISIEYVAVNEEGN